MGRRSVIAIAAAIIGNLSWANAACFASIFQIQHVNGALITLNKKELPYASEAIFPVDSGDVIEFNQGVTEFEIHLSSSEDTLWQVEFFPGDSSASFCLDNGCKTVEEPTVDFILIPSGSKTLAGMIIAYGVDSRGNPAIRMTKNSGIQAPSF